MIGCENFLILQESHTSFIRLVDCLVTSTFHQMVVKAVAHMLSVLQQRGCQSPSQSRSQSDPAEVSRTAAHAEIALDHTHIKVSLNNCSNMLGGFLFVCFFKSLVAETSDVADVPSMFTTELVLDTKALAYDPSEDKFQVSAQIANGCLYCISPISWFSVQESFSEIFGQMKQLVVAVGTLTQDPDVDLITEFKEDRVGGHSTPTALCCDMAVINNIVCIHALVCVQTLRYRDTVTSNLECVLSSDEHLQHLLQSIKVYLNARQDDSCLIIPANV